MSAIQADLWSAIPPPHVRGSETSAAAADDIRPSAETLRAKVYAYIAEHGPCSDETIANVLGLNPSTARPRRVELAKEHRIEPVGEGVTRSGRRCQLWAVAS